MPNTAFPFAAADSCDHCLCRRAICSFHICSSDVLRKAVHAAGSLRPATSSCTELGMEPRRWDQLRLPFFWTNTRQRRARSVDRDADGSEWIKQTVDGQWNSNVMKDLTLVC